MSQADRLAQKWVKFVLRSEMMRHDVTYDELAKRLASIGVVEESGPLRNRVSRGRFSGAFFFQCLAVIGTRNVNVELCDYIRDAGLKANGGNGLRRNGVRRVHRGRTGSDSTPGKLPN